VAKLIAGSDALICDECVAVCSKIVAEAPPFAPSFEGSAPRPQRRRLVSALRRFVRPAAAV